MKPLISQGIKILRTINYFVLSLVKALGSALIVLSSFIIIPLLIQFYKSPFDFKMQQDFINIILNFRMWVFWGVLIFETISNYKHIIKK